MPLTPITPAIHSATMLRTALASFARGDETGQAVKSTAGRVDLPGGDIDLGDEPLILRGPDCVAGSSVTSSRLIYSGTGAAVRIGTATDNGYAALTTLKDVSINAPNGSGVGLDDSAWNEWDRLTLENVTVNAKADGFNLWGKNIGNGLIMSRCRVVHAGGTALRVRSRTAMITGFDCVLQTETTIAGRAVVDLEGDGHFDGWIEAGVGKPLLRSRGTWDYLGAQHWETHSAPGIAVILDGWGADQRFPGTHTIPLPQFLMPKVPWALQGGATLDILGHDHGASSNDGGGGQDPAACFKLAPGSAVFVAGRQQLPASK